MHVQKVNEYVEREKFLTDLEYDFVKELVSLRKDNNLSQQKMADMANVIRETIARIENCMVSPQINTLIKILEPLGYTITIKKIDKDKK